MKRVLIALFFGVIAPGALSANSVTYSQNAQNNSVDPYSTYNQRPIFSQLTQPIPYPAAYAEQSSLTLTSAQWGFNGPLDLSVILSHLYGAIVSAQYTKRFGNYNAASLLLDGNDSQHRINLTWGSQLSDTQLLKMTMEHLSQKIKFSFVTGNDKEWVSQNAYGVEYKFLRPKRVLNDVDVKWYYSKAENIDLSPVFYFQDNVEWRNDRRIAGGIAQGGSAGVHFLPTRHTLIGTAVNYSSVHYDTRYNTTNDDSHGLGGSVSLEQLLTQRTKVHFLATDVVPLQHYEAGIDYTPKTELGTHLNLALSVARDIGGDGLRNDSQAILSLNYVWGDQPIAADSTTQQSTRQQWNNTTLGVTNTKQDLMAWTHQPAVKMAQVLAIADQRVVRVRNIVMIDLSDNGDWVMSPEVFKKRASANEEPIKEGIITVNTARGTLDETTVLNQLAAAKDAQGNQLGSYLNFDIVSENSHEIKVSAALRGDSPEFSGSDSFHIDETDTAGDSATATLKLTMIGTVPVGNDVNTNINKTRNEQVTKPLAQGSFSAKTPITDYKICPVNAKEIDDCAHSMDGVTINQSGEITVDASAVMITNTTTHWVIAGDVFGYSVPSATGPKIIVTTGDQPIGNNVKTLINTTPSTTIAPHDLEKGSFTSDDAPIIEYKLCKMGATNPEDPTECSTSIGTLKIDSQSGKISGTSPAEGNVTDWIVARNKFGYSELKEGCPSVTVVTGDAPQGDNIEKTMGTTAKHDVTVSFDTIPFTSSAEITDYDICSSDGTQCGHTIDDLTIQIDKGTGKLTVSGTAPDATTTYTITATNKYGTSTPSATDGPRVTFNIGLAPHGNNVEKSIAITPNAPKQVLGTFEKGTFDNVTSTSSYKICQIGAKTSDQCFPTLDQMAIVKNGDGSISVEGPSPSQDGDFTYPIIAINDYGSTEPSSDGPRLTIHTGAAPSGNNVEKSVNTTAQHSVTLNFDGIPFTSPSEITDYDICTSNGKQCGHTIDNLTVGVDKSTGNLTVSGAAPDATATYAITATNQYGTSTPSTTNGPRVTINVGLAPHGNNVEKSIGITPNAPKQVLGTFPNGTFDHVTATSNYKICQIGAETSDQCFATLDQMAIVKNGDGSISVEGPSPSQDGDFTYPIIAINDYGSTEPSSDGPRLTIHTGAVPVGKNVTVKPSGDVGPSDSIDLKVGSDAFSSTVNISGYLLCSSSTDKSSCKTSLNNLSIDSTGHITGHAPSDTKGATLTEWIVAVNEYGQSQLSTQSPKVVIDTYSTDGPTIVASANGHWPLDWDHANKYTETITVTPSKGNSLDPNSVYSIASSPKLDARGGSPFGIFYHVDNSGATKTAQKVIVTFKNSKFDGVTFPDYYYLTISDKKGHKTTVDPIITFS